MRRFLSAHSRYRYSVVVAFLMWAINTHLVLAQSVPKYDDLFVSADDSLRGLTDHQQTMLKTILGRKTTIDLKLVYLRNAQNLSGAKSLGLSLALPTYVRFNRINLEQLDRGGYVWQGSGLNNSRATLVMINGRLTGTVQTSNALCRIEPIGGGLHAIIHVNTSGFPDEPSSHSTGTLQTHEGKNGYDFTTPLGRALEKRFVPTSTTNINVLVAYTPSASNASGDIYGLIQTAISETNQSYVNSNINVHLDLVYSYEVNYVESGDWDTDLSRFAGTSDGYMDEVHTLRDEYHAAVCVLILNSSSGCGGLAEAIPATKETAFCEVHYDCATGYYTFGHEIGHLQGARHDRWTDPNLSPYEYGHGYVYSEGNWRTIMAYGTVTRIQYWSNPNINYGGIPMGTATYENNARVLNETASTVAGFGASSNLYVPLQYPTISAALSAAVSGETIIVSSANYTISSNLTVPSGVTLSLNPGATLTFSGYYKLRIEGALIASGSSGSPITFQGNGSAGSWFGIEFYNIWQGSSLSHCTIKDASYGINYINSSMASPSYSKITNNDRGVNCTNYSAPDFISTVFDWNNWDVYGDGTSTPELGTSYGPGYNSFRDPGYYQVYSTYSGTIAAEGNWWGDCPPSPSVTGNVDYSNYLCTDPNPLAKRIDGNPVVLSKAARSSSELAQLQTSTTNSDSGMTQLNEAYTLYLKGDYQSALKAFEVVVNSYPNNFSGCRALVFEESCLDKLGRSSEVLTSLNNVSAADAGTMVTKFAEARRTYEYLDHGMYQEALAQATETARSSDDTSLVKFALYDAGSISWYDLGNKETGEEYYRQLIARFQGDPLSASALATMGEAAAPSAPQLQANSATEKNEIVLGNYPNPFNPTTVISYGLKTGCHVTLKVYDVLGRVVATLVDGNENAGQHSVQFNGENLASGIYFYRLTAPGIDQIKKMILMK